MICAKVGLIEMPIYHDKKIIQIRIPKTASSSMENAIGSFEGGGYRVTPELLKHLTAKEAIIEYGQEAFDSYFKFSFSRNPFDYFISNAIYFSGPQMPFRSTETKKWVYNLNNIAESRGGNYFNIKSNDYDLITKKRHLSCGADRCAAFDGQHPCACLSRFKPQSDYVTGDNGEVLLDFIGSFDKIDDDWSRLCDIIGEEIPLGIVNKQNHSRANYLSMFDYDIEFLESVYKLYSHDCDVLGYDSKNYPGLKS